VIVDGRDTPLAATLTASNKHDVRPLEPLVDAAQAAAGCRVQSAMPIPAASEGPPSR
jgi:hypothetical protein